jgi:hypothetical protein
MTTVMPFRLTAKTKEDHSQHHKRLLGLENNQRPLKRVRADLLHTHRAAWTNT